MQAVPILPGQPVQAETATLRPVKTFLTGAYAESWDTGEVITCTAMFDGSGMANEAEGGWPDLETC